MVFTNTYILTGVVTCTALTNNDVSGNCCLASVNFYTETFAVGLTAVLGTTDPFFVCHGS